MRWTPSDLARLRCLSQTHTMAEAAEELGRKYAAVQCKVQAEGIPWQRYERPRWEPNRMRILTAEANGVVYETLTRKEHAVLLLLAAGATNVEIAAKLGLSESTVHRGHVPALIAKLHATNRVGAVIVALHLGVITLEDVPLDEVMAATYERQEDAVQP